MKTATLFVLAACAALPQEHTEFVTWMKIVNASANSLREKPTGPEAVGSAERIGAVYENMIGFWRQRNALDAIKLSEEGKLGAAMLANAISAGDTEKTAAALKTVTGTCKTCHDAHRERVAEGKYKIK